MEEDWKKEKKKRRKGRREGNPTRVSKLVPTMAYLLPSKGVLLFFSLILELDLPCHVSHMIFACIPSSYECVLKNIVLLFGSMLLKIPTHRQDRLIFPGFCFIEGRSHETSPSARQQRLMCSLS